LKLLVTEPILKRIGSLRQRQRLSKIFLSFYEHEDVRPNSVIEMVAISLRPLLVFMDHIAVIATVIVPVVIPMIIVVSVIPMN